MPPKFDFQMRVGPLWLIAVVVVVICWSIPPEAVGTHAKGRTRNARSQRTSGGAALRIDPSL